MTWQGGNWGGFTVLMGNKGTFDKTSFISLKGATEFYFMYYLHVVSILFSLGLYISGFSTYSFGKTRFLFFMFLHLWLLLFSFTLCFEFNVFLKDLITLYNQGIKSIMYLFILFSLYWNNLLNYKNCGQKHASREVLSS